MSNLNNPLIHSCSSSYLAFMANFIPIIVIIVVEYCIYVVWEQSYENIMSTRHEFVHEICLL